MHECVCLAYADNCVVGAICCRLEPVEHHLTLQRTYIMTLGVLESYRQCHIGVYASKTRCVEG